MKYIVYWEKIPEHRKIIDEIVKNKLPELSTSDDFPKPLTVSYSFPGKMKGFRLYEVTKPEQIANYSQLFGPLMDIEWVPILESTDMIAARNKYGKVWSVNLVQ